MWSFSTFIDFLIEILDSFLLSPDPSSSQITFACVISLTEEEAAKRTQQQEQHGFCVHICIKMNQFRWAFVLRDWKSISINNQLMEWYAIKWKIGIWVKSPLFFHTLWQMIPHWRDKYYKILSLVSIRLCYDTILMNNCFWVEKVPFLPT